VANKSDYAEVNGMKAKPIPQFVAGVLLSEFGVEKMLGISERFNRGSGL